MLAIDTYRRVLAKKKPKPKKPPQKPKPTTKYARQLRGPIKETTCNLYSLVDQEVFCISVNCRCNDEK